MTYLSRDTTISYHMYVQIYRYSLNSIHNICNNNFTVTKKNTLFQCDMWRCCIESMFNHIFFFISKSLEFILSNKYETSKWSIHNMILDYKNAGKTDECPDVSFVDKDFIGERFCLKNTKIDIAWNLHIFRSHDFESEDFFGNSMNFQTKNIHFFHC